MFCPQCRSEYRAGFTHCATCDALLVDRLTDLESPAVLVRIRSYSNDSELFLAKGLLESAGIDAMVSPPDQAAPPPRSFGIGLPATDLFVRAEDAIIANEILSSASEG